jgi:MoaA/NifB/PqqE/SkfB family radical SAM enzyme
MSEPGAQPIVQKRRPKKDRPRMKVEDSTLDPHELVQIESTLRDVDWPPQIIIEVTNACNLRCAMCAHSIITRTPTLMADDLFDRIVEEIAAENPETRVWLSFYGEALLARDRLWRFIRQAKVVGLRDLTLNTNGTMLNNEKIGHLVHDGLDRLVFSIDGFTKETYERVRIGASHDDVYTHVSRVIERAQANGGKPEIMIQIIDMPATHDELPAFIEYWSALGAIVKVKNLVGWTGQAVDRPMHEEHRITCPWVMTTFPITAIGEALLCGTDYDARMPMGNVRHHSIRELWTRHQQYRRIHMEKRWDELPELCRGCTDWQIGGATTYFPDGRVYHLGREVDAGLAPAGAAS